MFKKTLLLSGIALCLLGANDASAMKKRSILFDRKPTTTPEQDRESIAAFKKKQWDDFAKREQEEKELAKKGDSIPTPIKPINPSASTKKRSILFDRVPTTTPEQDRESIAAFKKKQWDDFAKREQEELAKRGASIPAPIKVVDPSARVDDETPKISPEQQQAINVMIESVSRFITEATSDPAKLDALKELFLSQENAPYALAALNSFDGTKFDTEIITDFFERGDEGLDAETNTIFNKYYAEKSNKSTALGTAAKIGGTVLATTAVGYMVKKALDYFLKK